jgi:putative oxidoreductase
MRLLLRLTIGGLFAGHGLQKLAGWFGGHGPEGTGAFFEQVGLRPGRAQAVAAGAAELGGGTLLALGLATPMAAATLTAVMANAVRHVHGAKGPWNQDGGWELHAIVVAALALLAETGPGPLSLDAALGVELRGTPAALAALAAGAAGAVAAPRFVAALAEGRSAGTPAEPPSTPAPAATAA